MVKNFKELVNESKLIGEVESSKETPECLLKIVDFINSKTLKTNISKDGRVSSIKDEDDCINLLRTSDDWDVIDEKYESGDKMTIVVPDSREWYDIEVVDNGKHYYVNIKSSTFKSYDNVGSPSFILYGLFGKMKSIKDMTTAEKYAELYLEYNRHEESGYDDVKDFDYYFLIINKNNNRKCFVTSLNHITKDSIKPNGSNPPFQCNWVKNSSKIVLKKSEIADIIMDVTFHSLVKSVDIFETEPMKKYIEKHKKRVSVPLWED